MSCSEVQVYVVAISLVTGMVWDSERRGNNFVISTSARKGGDELLWNIESGF